MRLRYQKVCLESFGYVLPKQVVSSAQIEQQLEPLYRRLRLPQGRLEFMTGIQQRRLWETGTLPSEKSVLSVTGALAAAELDRQNVGALVHGSVCRDHLEPATASRVHCEAGLPADCLIYDVSNACLGLLNGIVQVANMIELGQIRAGVVVGTEGSRQLLENTIERLNRDTDMSRQAIKSIVASLTIGSASCAVVLINSEISRTGNRLVIGTGRAHTAFHRLCHSGGDEAVADGMSPWMETDSEQLMHEGIATGVETFGGFLAQMQEAVGGLDKTVCHQVGSAHRKLLLESLGLDPVGDFATLQTLGNTGSVALPVTMALGCEQGHFQSGDRVGLLGIGSGINCVMLGVEWHRSLVSGRDESLLGGIRPEPRPEGRVAV